MRSTLCQWLSRNAPHSFAGVVLLHWSAAPPPPALPCRAGLPEDVSHTKQALARGYTLLAMEPHDAKGLCWSSSVKGGYVNDQPDVRRRGWAGRRMHEGHSGVLARRLAAFVLCAGAAG